MLGCGFLFTALSAASIFTGKFIYGDVFTFHWPSWLSGTVQYAFIFIGFPILAGYFLSAGNVRDAIRYIALGYLPPMLLNILLLPNSAWPWMREMFFWANRALGTYGNANSFAMVITLTFPYYAYLIATEKGLWRNIGYIGMVALLSCLLLSGSFSGFIVFSCVFLANFALIILWRKNPLRSHVKSLAINIILLALLTCCSYMLMRSVSPGMLDSLDKRFFPAETSQQSKAETTDDETVLALKQEVAKRGSADIRMELNKRAVELIIERNGGIFYGHGMRQTLLLPQFTILDTKFDVHMVYLLLWIEGGLVLSLTFLAYLILLMRNCWNMAKSHPAEAIAIFSSVLAITLFGAFNTQEYLRYFWVPLLPAFVTGSRRVLENA